jgi:hypothetical protein
MPQPKAEPCSVRGNVFGTASPRGTARLMLYRRIIAIFIVLSIGILIAHALGAFRWG